MDSTCINFDTCRQLLIIPTRGHCVLLYKNRFMFTCDLLWWSRDSKQLSASEDVCWYSCPEQIRSIERLLDFTFEWVLLVTVKEQISTLRWKELMMRLTMHSQRHNHGIYCVSNEKVITVEELISMPFCILGIHSFLTFYSVLFMFKLRCNYTAKKLYNSPISAG